jgi:hypothetical protein
MMVIHWTGQSLGKVKWGASVFRWCQCIYWLGEIAERQAKSMRKQERQESKRSTAQSHTIAFINVLAWLESNTLWTIDEISLANSFPF